MQKYAIEYFRPELNEFHNQVKITGIIKFEHNKNVSTSYINNEGVYCFVGFSGAQGCVGMQGFKENSMVTMKLVYLNTVIGRVPLVMFMSTQGQIELDRTPKQALDLWNETSDMYAYDGSIGLTAIAIAMMIFIRLIKKGEMK